MTGTLLAVILAPLVATLGAFALLAHFRRKDAQEATKTPQRPAADYVTREQLKAAVEAAVEDATKDITFEWNEMYEKFEKLHLRLAKRDKRAQQPPQEQLQIGDDPRREQALARSALPFRRFGSV